MKLASYGGRKTRVKKMPSRFSFGRKEKLEIDKMISYYKKRDEDPKYSGLWESKFCKAFSEFMGGGFADAVATGTGAIYVAMKALEIPKNSEIIIEKPNVPLVHRNHLFFAKQRAKAKFR